MRVCCAVCECVQIVTALLYMYSLLYCTCGDSVPRLQVVPEDAQNTTTPLPIWQLTGEQGSDWYEAKVAVTNKQNFKVRCQFTPG